METVMLVLVVMLCVITGIVLICKSEYDDKWKPFIGFLFIIASPIIGVIVDYYINDDEYIQQAVPQAIDVYRGKTTLQITYQDSIPVDSAVVFKDNTK